MLQVLTSPYFTQLLSFVIGNYIKCNKTCENVIYPLMETLIELIVQLRREIHLKKLKKLFTKMKQQAIIPDSSDPVPHKKFKLDAVSQLESQASAADEVSPEKSSASQPTTAAPFKILENPEPDCVDEKICLLIPNLMNILFEKRLPQTLFNKEKMRDVLILLSVDRDSYSNSSIRNHYNQKTINEYIKKCHSKSVCKLVKELYVY